VAVVAGVAMLLAMAAAGSRARVGGGPSVGSAALRLGFGALEFLAAVALLGGLALLVVGFPRLRRRRDDEPEWVVERPPVPWYTKLLALGLVVIVLGGLAGSLLVLRHQLEERQAAPPAPTAPAPPQVPSSVPPAAGNPPGTGDPLLPVVWAIGVVAVAAAGWAVAPRLRFRRRVAKVERRRAEAAQPVVEEALRLSLEDLRREPDPRRAIVAAYARMLAVLGRLGMRRRAAEAPLEYLRRLLGELEGDPEPARRLTELFELAEFSRAPVTEAMRAEAIGALGTIRARLGAGV
jgi:uncharacterized protein DUF4129